MAEWDVSKIAAMDHEQNLRNTCRQLEQHYVIGKGRATHNGFCIVRQWPMIGDLGRYRVKDEYAMEFVTTHNRSVQIRLPNGEVIAECKMQEGLANELYLEAGRILDIWDR